MIPKASGDAVYCTCCTACNLRECLWSRRYTLSSTADDRGNRGPAPVAANRHERRRAAALERAGRAEG